MSNEQNYWYQKYVNACDENILMHKPSLVYKPKLYIDGNQWCALYGDNIQDGVAGFGKSPAEAMNAFDIEWNTKIKD